MSNTDPTNSCSSCPQRLTDEADIKKYFRRAPGAPMCAKFGHILGKPGLKPVQLEKVNQIMGASCASYGEPLSPRSDRADNPSSYVSTGDPTIPTTKPDQWSPEFTSVTSCDNCAHYVEPRAVLESWGWTFGMCAQSGRLLWPNNLTTEAGNCEWKQRGIPRTSTGSAFLHPMFVEAESYDPNPVTAWLSRKGQPIVEPRDYVTDKPVEPEDSDAGIRAWRRLDDPDGTGNFTFLPIYDTAFFPEEEAAKIPQTGSDEHPEWYVDHKGLVYEVAVMWRELDMTPAIWGEPGTGKTELFRHIAWLMNLPFDRINLKESSDPADLIGEMAAVDGENGSITQFRYGRLSKRWVRPGVLVLDEANAAPPAVWHLLRSVTDNSKQLVLDENGGEIMDRDLDCYLGVTGNPAWDTRNLGVAPIAAADTSRLLHVELELPPDVLEREIIKTWCSGDGYTIPDETLNVLMKVAADLRQMAKDNTLDAVSWGLRDQVQVARLSRWFALPKCYLRAVGDAVEPEKRQMILESVQSFMDPNYKKPDPAASPAF